MRKRLLSVAASAALLSMGAQAQSVEFKNIYSLGDSLSDVGTYSNAVRPAKLHKLVYGLARFVAQQCTVCVRNNARTQSINRRRSS